MERGRRSSLTHVRRSQTACDCARSSNIINLRSFTDFGRWPYKSIARVTPGSTHVMPCTAELTASDRWVGFCAVAPVMMDQESAPKTHRYFATVSVKAPQTSMMAQPGLRSAMLVANTVPCAEPPKSASTIISSAPCSVGAEIASRGVSAVATTLSSDSFSSSLISFTLKIRDPTITNLLGPPDICSC